MTSSIVYKDEWGAQGAAIRFEYLLATLAYAALLGGVTVGARLLCPHLPARDLLVPPTTWGVVSGALFFAPIVLLEWGGRTWRWRLSFIGSLILVYVMVGICLPAFAPTSVFKPLTMSMTLAAATAYACATSSFLSSARCGVFQRGPAVLFGAIGFAVQLLIGPEVAGITLALSVLSAGVSFVALSYAPLIDHIEAEAVCLWEMYHFTRRHLRYLLIGVYIYPGSLLAWRRRQMMRVGFCLLQHVDDILDGDRDCEREPLEVVDDLIQQIQTRAFEYNALGVLARQLLRSFDRYALPDDSPYDELLELLKIMQRDRRRVLHGQPMSREALRTHLTETFHYSVSVLLIYSGAELRAHRATHLVEALAWCSVMRDLEEDLGKGLNNIPEEVWAGSDLDPQSLPRLEWILRDPSIQAWMREEYLRGLAALDASAEQLAELEGTDGYLQLNIFQKSVRKFATKLPRKYRFLEPPSGGMALGDAEAIGT